jgi:hypothetical protein
MVGRTDLVGSLLGNVGTLLLFRLGVLDAERMALYMQPQVSARDLQDLPNFHVAAKLLTDGRPSRAFVFRTREAVDPASASGSDQGARQKRLSDRQAGYTREARAVEREILERRQKILAGTGAPFDDD